MSLSGHRCISLLVTACGAQSPAPAASASSPVPTTKILSITHRHLLASARWIPTGPGSESNWNERSEANR
jgi:hypothetical protein